MAIGPPIRFALGWSTLLASACGNPAPSVATSGQPTADCSYVASLNREQLLAVHVSCRGSSPTSFEAEPGVARYVSALSTLSGDTLDFDGNVVPVTEPGLSYRVDLAKMAAERRDFNHALRVGKSIIAPGYSWMLSPTEVPDDLPVQVRVEGTTPEHRFVSGLELDGPNYVLRANEVRVATFGVFGSFEQETLDVGGLDDTRSEIDVVTLDATLAVGPSVRRRWVRETAAAVAAFYGGFPVEHALLAVVPVAGPASVLSGKVLPESKPGVALLIGSHAGPEDLYGDWILTHELFHLGFPSFVGEGKWLDEGLATYFEPLIRARKHWLSAEAVWAEFVRYMPRGARALERDGLENPKSYAAMYWAGALVALMADVEALKRSQGTRGLQHALRALLRAGGEASRVWRLDHAVQHIDQTLGAPILARLAKRYELPGTRVPLDRLFQELGVKKSSGSVVLDDDAPLAHVRRAISRGAQ